MKKLFCLSAALSIAAVCVLANPVVTGNDRGVKKKKENPWEPNTAIEFQFSKDFPKANSVNWTYHEFVEAHFLKTEGLKPLITTKKIIWWEQQLTWTLSLCRKKPGIY